MSEGKKALNKQKTSTSSKFLVSSPKKYMNYIRGNGKNKLSSSLWPFFRGKNVNLVEINCRFSFDVFIEYANSVLKKGLDQTDTEKRLNCHEKFSSSDFPFTSQQTSNLSFLFLDSKLDLFSWLVKLKAQTASNWITTTIQTIQLCKQGKGLPKFLGTS